jgi:hypothetical protein
MGRPWPYRLRRFDTDHAGRAAPRPARGKISGREARTNFARVRNRAADEQNGRSRSLSCACALQSLETLAQESAAGLGPKLSCAILVVDNASGEIRAHVGSADYFSQEQAGSIDMTLAIRSPGFDTKTVYLRARLRCRYRPPGNIARRPAETLWELCAGKFRSFVSGMVTARRRSKKWAPQRRWQPLSLDFPNRLSTLDLPL